MAKLKKVAKSKTKGAKPVAKAAKTTAPKSAVRKPAGEPGWVDSGKGVVLAIRDGELVARKDGKQLASVPKPAKESAVGEQLAAAIDFLEDHARSCQHSVETWMLRSLPVPADVLAAVAADPAWADALRDLWVVAHGAEIKSEVGGFFRGVDATRGVGVVDRDGETGWLASSSVLIPHPILLDELDDLRQMAVEIGAHQGTAQLFRETFTKPTAPKDPTEIDQFSGGEFAMLQQVTGLAKRLGYRVSGGAAVCRVLERGRFVEARYDLGDGDGMSETTTGNLNWVDDKQRPLAIADVPPIAFSEGMRMAQQIYAKRKIEKAGEEN